MLYIFLDFDGVTHTHNGKRFSLVDNIAKVIQKYPEIKIVFSTSWREYATLEVLTKYLPEVLHAQCVGVTPLFKEPMLHDRYHEIQQYLSDNNIKDKWLAIDDIAKLFPKDCKHLFLVNGGEGVTPAVARRLEKKIKSLLQKNTIQPK